MTRGEVARNVSRGALFLGLEKGVAMCSTIAYSALMARWLGPTKYGMLTIAFSVVSWFTVFTGNFEMYLERYAAEYQVQDRVHTLRRAYGLALAVKLALGLVASAVLLGLTAWISRFYKIPELALLLPLLVVFLATDGLSTTGRSLLFGLQRYGWVSGLSLVFNVGKTLLVGFLWWRRQGLVALAIGFSGLALLQALVICGAAIALLARARARAPSEAPEPAVEGGLLRSMVRYCLPLYGGRLSFLSGQNLGKLVLGRVLDATQLGYFTFAFQTVERFVELANALPMALLPSLTQIIARDERERLRYVFDQAFRLIQLAACGLSFVLFVYAHELVRLVGSPLFEPAVPMLRILALVPIARTAQQPLTMLFQAMRRPGLVFALALTKLGTEIAGYFALLLPLGVMGACWANLAGATSSFVFALVLLAGLLPEGRAERTGAVVRNLLLMLPALAVTLFLERQFGRAASFPLRLALVGPSLLGVFALGLITRYDLEKFRSVPLPGTWLNRTRETLLGGADRLVRAFEPRRAA